MSTDDPASTSSAPLPMVPREGVPPVSVTGEWAAAELVSAPLSATVRRIALPAVASSLLMTLFTSVDMYWVGTRVGADGLAAVSTSVFWIWMLVSLAEMVSVGLTALAARRHGEQRPGEAARAAGQSLVFALLLGAVVAAAGFAALRWCFAVMQTPPHVTELGLRYLGTYFIGSPLIFGFFAVDAAFRASGDTRTPFRLLAISVAVTLVLDPVLILGLWGAPKLGIAGAAVATVLTRGAVFVMGFQIARRRGLVRLEWPAWVNVGAVVRIGLPTAVTGMFFSLIYVLLTRTTQQFGTPALAALGIGHRVESWLYMAGVGFGAATAAIVGQNLGARQPERAARAGWIAVGYCTLAGIAAWALQLSAPEWFASLFSDDPAVIAEGAKYLRIAAWSQLFICGEIVLEGALGGAGDTLPPMLTSSAFTFARIPLAAWAAAQWGSEGIWWVISLTAIGRALAMMGIWYSGRWARRAF